MPPPSSAYKMLSLFSPATLVRCSSLVASTVSICALWLAEQSVQSVRAAPIPTPSRLSSTAAAKGFYARSRANVPLVERPAPFNRVGIRRVGGQWAPKPTSPELEKRTTVTQPLQRTQANTPKPRAKVASLEASGPRRPVSNPSKPRASSSAAFSPIPRASAASPAIRGPTCYNPSASRDGELRTSASRAKQRALLAWLDSHRAQLGSPAAVAAARAYGDAWVLQEEPYERALITASLRCAPATRTGMSQRRARLEQRMKTCMDAYLAQVVPVAAPAVPAASPRPRNRSPLANDCTADLTQPAPALCRVRFALAPECRTQNPRLSRKRMLQQIEHGGAQRFAVLNAAAIRVALSMRAAKMAQA